MAKFCMKCGVQKKTGLIIAAAILGVAALAAVGSFIIPNIIKGNQGDPGLVVTYNATPTAIPANTGNPSNAAKPTQTAKPSGGINNSNIGTGGMAAGFTKAKTAVKSGDAANMSWPASGFPLGHPVYPDGEVVYTESYFDNDLILLIAETSKMSFDSYLHTLKAAGWNFEEPEEGIEFAYKGNWSIALLFDEIYEGEYGAFIYICDIGFDLDELYADFEWPDMPVAIPVYTDGNIAFVTVDEEDAFYSIMISDTSVDALDIYRQELVGLGWTWDGGDDWMMDVETGVWYLTLGFNDSDNTVFIGLFFIGEYDYNAEAFDFTGWSDDE